MKGGSSSSCPADFSRWARSCSARLTISAVGRVVERLRMPRHLDGAFARLPKPLATVKTIQLRLQFRGKRQQIMHIIKRVFNHARRQRPHRPIGFLRVFVKLNTKKALHEGTQTELADPKKSRCNDCVEDSGGRKI